mmetsp:Transcript_17058/g.48049  ORF Transcript_17058/g.48049 Transcript_17058/m.48049 type:complete len:81 (-) Transcript_17058:244-486(-)
MVNSYEAGMKESLCARHSFRTNMNSRPIMQKKGSLGDSSDLLVVPKRNKSNTLLDLPNIVKTCRCPAGIGGKKLPPQNIG